ncbi:MAG: magnesium transporter [Proteobacteria bacterium]|nr:magnesium transporter [Pseudomonadota bacterium]MBU1739718.1 magnesium transporter [Pseudomonadota bacterium]
MAEKSTTKSRTRFLREMLAGEDQDGIRRFFDRLSMSETALIVSRLHPAEQKMLITILDPSDAADVMEDIPTEQLADIIEDLPPEQAISFMEELPNSRKNELLSEMEGEEVEAILHVMEPEQADEARKMLSYPQDTAGALMMSEFLAYNDKATIGSVLADLQSNKERYHKYNVQYIYVVDDTGMLVGVLRVHDLLFALHSALLEELMIRDPLHVRVTDTIKTLGEFFQEHKFFGVPVVDEDGVLAGVLRPVAVEEAFNKKSVHQFLGFSGIVGGEEFRTMPLLTRSGRRLSWLSINIFLNIMAASIIALYQDTLASAIALAIFLPMISDMSGCSGNQAVAVSMRELTLGLLKKQEFLRVFAKEIGLGFINGIALGALLGVIAFLWKGNLYLGLVVGGALMLNTVIAVCFGGILPLLLKKFKLDPALVASPVLTTVTDMCGFFLVFSLATLVLAKISGV